MEQYPDLPEKCILCGTNLKLPPYECKNRNKCIEKNEIIMDKDKKARCPLCTPSLVFTAMIVIVIKSKKNGREIKERRVWSQIKGPKQKY